MRTQIIPGISLHYFIKQKHRRRTNTVNYRTNSTQADLVGGGGWRGESPISKGIRFFCLCTMLGLIFKQTEDYIFYE